MSDEYSFTVTRTGPLRARAKVKLPSAGILVIEGLWDTSDDEPFFDAAIRGEPLFALSRIDRVAGRLFYDAVVREAEKVFRAAGDLPEKVKT